MRQPGLVTPRPKPIAESCCRERLAVLGHEERQIAGRASRDDVGEDRQHRLLRRLQSLVARLSRHHAQPAVFDVLTPQRHDIAAAHAEKEQEREREPRLGADRVPLLELPDLVDRPGVKSVVA